MLARRVNDGGYPAGPSCPRNALAEEFGCWPSTAAQALRLLQRDGLATLPGKLALAPAAGAAVASLARLLLAGRAARHCLRLRASLA